MKRIALYPGSFDPMTNGHLDILTRLSALYDEVYAAVMVNPAKTPYLDTETRVSVIEEATAHLPNVKAVSATGATVTLARQLHATVLVRGLRSVTDFEYETTLAAGNKLLAPEIETLFLMAKPEWAYVSSSIVREIDSLSGAVDALVPPSAVKAMEKRKEKKQ